MKSIIHALHVVLVLSLLGVNPAASADPRPSIPTKSFKGGFSSQRSAPAPKAPSSSSASRGGFGSFNSAPARAPQKSDSALSQQMDKGAAEANALRTINARRAAQQQSTQPVPGYENRQYGQPGQPMPMPVPQQAPQSGNGMAGVVTGLVLGQIANGAHARNNNGYPAQVNNGTSSATVNQAPARSFFGGIMHLFLWLVALSAIGWLIYFLVQRNRRKTAENKPHYTFEGQ